METRLRALLDERGMTAQQLADMVGCTKGGIDSVMHRGVSTITKAKIYAMVLKVHVWELFMEPEISAIGHPVTEWSTETRIEELLNERGIKQIDIAAKMGKKQNAVSKYVHADNLSMTLLEEFAAELNLPVWQLLISPEDYEREMAKRRGEVSEPAAQTTVAEEQTASAMDDLFGWGDKTVEEIMEEEALLAEQEKNEALKRKAQKMLPVLNDGEYRYGNMVLVLKDGKVELKSV